MKIESESKLMLLELIYQDLHKRYTEFIKCELKSLQNQQNFC